MGNFRCYLCSKEFWRESSLGKHLEKKECPRLNEVDEFNTPDGKERSDAIFNLIDVLERQGKTSMEGNLFNKESKIEWKYTLTREIKSEQK